MTIGFLTFVVSVSARSDGCAAWHEQLATDDPDHTWPSGLNLSIPGPERNRATDAARLTLLFTIFTTHNGFFLAVSLLLDLQTTLAESRAETARTQAAALVRALTYVNHHARGPLNAAVLCMTLLEMDNASVAQEQPREPAARVPSANTAPSTADGAHSSECPSTRGQGDAFSSRCSGVHRSGSIGKDATSKRMIDGVLVPTVEATLRDLHIALESSKQELDDLLLWQRLSLRKTTTLRSWGTMGSSWEERLSRHFASHRRAAALTLDAAVAMVAIGTYAAAARSSRFKPGRVCVSVSVSTGRGAMAGLQWPQPLAPRRGMRGSERGALCVEVRFTGQGYSAAELEGDPFDPFGRLRHGDDSLSVGPTGLRLAVVRGVAVSLGGEAGLGSGGAESGAHVWLRVPVAVVRRSSEAWYDHWHALVARRSGAATRTFADGAQLVAAVEAAMDAGEAERGPVGAPPGSGSLWELPDGVLVDGHMPVMGGVEAIRAIVSLGEARAPWWRPRLWLVTGEATPRVESEASRAGADGVLCKPVTGALVVSSLLSQAP
ncbi:hypothetical protein FNF28_04897 [Cafeteria roenbergensis]|uniref:histidine kinase n=1 Tax=Cafeteria roenbergensis TaxID=33653 RepID=A0A5A8DCI0_CAFRO|nr:hypothetical protein FNF28_04897 [Cafeteria roenbergensis]